jgi:hypothetical protein
MEKDQLGDLGIDGRIIVKRILKKCGHLVLVSRVMNLLPVAHFCVCINQIFNESAKTIHSIYRQFLAVNATPKF